MIKCRNCSNYSLSSAIRLGNQPLLPLLVFLAITGSFFVEVDSVMERERAGQVKAQLLRDEAQSPLQSVDPQSQSQPQLQLLQQQQQPLPPTTMTTKSDIANTYKINSSTNTETVKIGNSKTKNYNFQESNYLPTQLTQVVLNVPKTHSRILRRTRPPTVDEFMIKRKILDVYDKAASELSGAFYGKEANLNGAVSSSLPASAGVRAVNGQKSLYFNHLGRILQALNPKYIATERVRDVAFADPADPNGPVQLPDVPPQLLALELNLGGTDETVKPVKQVSDLLLELEDKFRSQVSWDQDFIAALSETNDEQLQPSQLAFKRLLICLNDPSNVNYSTMTGQLNTDIGAASSNQEQQVVGENINENNFEDYGESQQNLVYAMPNNQVKQEPAVVYDRQMIQNKLEPSYNNNYNQYAFPENSLPPRAQPQPPMEPLRFKSPPPPAPYGLQNKRDFNQFKPHIQTPIKLPSSSWPSYESRPPQPRTVSPDSVNNPNNNYRLDSLRNRYQFRAQAPPQKYAYQPYQKQLSFV